MSPHKMGMIACLVLAVSVMGLWFSKGTHMATPEQVQVEKVTKDDFGDEVKTVKWVPNDDPLEIGLDIAGPATALFVGLAGLLFFLERRKES